LVLTLTIPLLDRSGYPDGPLGTVVKEVGTWTDVEGVAVTTTAVVLKVLEIGAVMTDVKV
jgi:hypothetical protein